MVSFTGTTWVSEIVSMVSFGGDEEANDKIMLNCRAQWMEVDENSNWHMFSRMLRVSDSSLRKRRQLNLDMSYA